MEKESKSGGISSSGIIAVVMLTAGVLFIREAPLETTRLPVNEPRIQRHVAVQDVDARLWQDPFGAVARAREDAAKRDATRAAEADAQRTALALDREIGSRMQRSKRTVEVMAVLLPGGPYSDDIESRRRTRYAVLAGLNASRLAPVDGDHLGYFFPTDPVKPDRALPEIVPYEWFEPAPDVQQRAGDETQPTVLVMWLDGDVFGGEPLRKMSALIGKFTQKDMSWRVLGPGGSDGLRDMVDEVQLPAFAQDMKPALANLPLRFYSASATAPDERLLPMLPPEEREKTTLSAYLARSNVRLVRTIGDDSDLADALIDELELRGLHAGKLVGPRTVACDENNHDRDALSHIAVISEWDTLYGRTLRREFRATDDDKGFCVDRFTYVRGLDGQLPASSADTNAAKTPASKTGADGKDDSRRRDGTFVEVAEGQSQFDYLRRLSVQMSARDKKLAEHSRDGVGLRAIGVLGSDVHDKLLVLQALQAEFPNAIFFTTDLDARFLHPRERAWARNLIVGSNFGLRLADRMQAGIPPFRDSYQTSAFLATRIAMDDARRARMDRGDARALDATLPTSQEELSSWFRQPRMFEIGRTMAFDFSTPLSEHDLPPDRGGARRPCEGPQWTRCGGIHAPASPTFPYTHFATRFMLASVIMFAFWVPLIGVSRSVRKWLTSSLIVGAKGGELALRWVGLFIALGLLHVLLPWWIAKLWPDFATWLTHKGKPLVALEGISIWPTEALRAVTLVLCFYLIFSGWAALTDNLDDIIVRFKLGRTRRELIADQRAAEKGLPCVKRFANMFSLRFVQPTGVGRTPQLGMSGDTIDFWRRYIVQNRVVARATRTTVCVVIALFVSGCLWLAVRDGWFIPQRGVLSLKVHQWLHGLMILAMYFLVFFVVDATAFCVSFVRGLRVHGANWPPSTLAEFEKNLDIPRAYLDNWIDLEFIAWRTKCVTRLIYFPFIVLSLFLVSRSAAFDDWYMPATGITLSVLGAGIALACAVALRFAAEASRRQAMGLMRDALSFVNSKRPADPAAAQPVASTDPGDPAGHILPPNPPTPRQLELLLARMDALHEGAFAPFWQQPLLKAVLLPFATLGGTTLLDYLALVNV